MNAPLAITHRATIQPILTKKSGGPVATFLGSASSETYIKGEIDRVWAQSGVSIQWLAPVVYESDFAYDGSPHNYSSTRRPQGDLDAIVDGAASPPRHADATVLNMFFVEIVPGFTAVSENTANGLAYIDANGSVVQVGSNLLGWSGGRDVVASVIAHEIGHNLGLRHVSGTPNNLMSPGGETEQLTASQTTTVFTAHGWVDGYDFLVPQPAESNYAHWAALHGVTGGPSGDHDGDRIANVIEFMLGLDATASSALPEMTWGASGLTWTLAKRADALADGLTYAVEVSNDGHLWHPAGSPAVPSTVLADTGTTLSVRLAPGHAASFMRLAAAIPAELEAASRTFLPLKTAAQLNAGRKPARSACAPGSCGCMTAPDAP